jgi:hypothetical protein
MHNAGYQLAVLCTVNPNAIATHHRHLLQDVCSLRHLALSLTHGGQPASKARTLNLNKYLRGQQRHRQQVSE